MTTVCEVGGIAFGIGGTAKRPYIRIVLRMRSKRTDTVEKRLSEFIKNFIPVLCHERGTVACMFMADHQSWTPVSGQIQKGRG